MAHRNNNPSTCKQNNTNDNRYDHDALRTSTVKFVLAKRLPFSFASDPDYVCYIQLYNNIKYNHTIARRATAWFILAKGLPFTFASDLAFEHHMQLFNPHARIIPESMVKSDCFALYNLNKQLLIEKLANLKATRVALTCHCWRDCFGEHSLMCIACHWIDSNWMLQKRMIHFGQLDPFDPINVSDMILDACHEYNIFKQVFSISFDDASAEKSSIDHLIAKFNPPIHELFYVKSNSHVIHLIVSDALEEAKPYIDSVRECVLSITCGSKRLHIFKQICKERGIKYKEIPLEVRLSTGNLQEHKWDSSYNMWSAILPLRTVIEEYCNEYGLPNYSLTPVHWQWIEALVKFLKPFKEATLYFSQVYTYTTAGTLFVLVDIMKSIGQQRNEKPIWNLVRKAEENFLKYYHPLPLLYSMAAVMDPRVKLDGLRDLLELYYAYCPECIQSYDYNEYVDCVEKQLQYLYTYYENLYATEILQSQKRQRAPYPPSSSFATKSEHSIGQSILSMLASKEQKQGVFNDLTTYLRSSRYNPEDDSVDVLEYWKINSINWPILSSMARDLLTPPTSAVASNSAFDINGRILDEKRNQMGLRTLQMYMCSQDWIRAETRKQGLEEDSEEGCESASSESSQELMES